MYPVKKISTGGILVFLVLFLFSTFVSAQRACSVSGINFACPSKYFPEVKIGDKQTRIFKYRERGDDLFFFISVPAGSFEPAEVARLAYAKAPTAAQFDWMVETEPFLMDFETSHRPEISVWLGLNETKLLEVKAFHFDIGKRKFVLGYLSDLTEDQRTNAARFKAAKGFADNAAGCNEVMTILNSVTKEFKDKDQGCTLTAQF